MMSDTATRVWLHPLLQFARSAAFTFGRTRAVPIDAIPRAGTDSPAAQQTGHLVTINPGNVLPHKDAWQCLDEGTNVASSSLPATFDSHVVCTLAEGNYFYGVAALANSLVTAGFRGSILVGYRGDRPSWLEGLEKDLKVDAYLVTPEVRLEFIELPGTWHLSNQKPHFMMQIFFEVVPNAELVYFFDTDVVITCGWSTFARWAREGVVVALDMADTYMSPHHVYRRAWKALAATINRPCRDFTGYVNGGCVGINRQFVEFVAVWALLMEELERDKADMTKMKNWTGRREFARMDQDVLNTTIMATETPIALLGAEAMGWFPATGEVMVHAMLHKKPWVRNYILDALRGFPPDHINHTYWQFVEGPIRPFGEWQLRRKKAALKIARAIGLFRRRSLRDL